MGESNEIDFMISSVEVESMSASRTSYFRVEIKNCLDQNGDA